ncbi:GNAT family N-acetyltransferase [Paenibacillus prosopidis]|uniref:RimJ/RimL family protein N-acetyltransferase n=1 Tax=Paenibacillus prosopidis TaxID=630520 RepID=A0A368W2C1_9BACL|nr:GNAT family N-acetyltransferase [Paenibacillus prosopidis]RCW49175.1 RimJ/RimL family protein N-acetyltransferase [Paenibacillus prosopidis]
MDEGINPILLTFPESFETERLIIRAPQWGEGVLVNQAILESVEELRQWMPFVKTIPTVDESERYIRKARLNFLERVDLVLLVFDKHTSEFVGSSGLHNIDWGLRKFEIGYWIRTSRSGYGLMTEAVNGITRFAIDHLEANRIEIRCNARNLPSARLAERAGFTLEGILRNQTRDEAGTLGDKMIFSKVKGIEY